MITTVIFGEGYRS